MKLKISIEPQTDPDGSDMSITIKGDAMSEIFQEGGDAWNHIANAVHLIASHMGPGPHQATIESE
jgi:hypothetical protein